MVEGYHRDTSNNQIATPRSCAIFAEVACENTLYVLTRGSRPEAAMILSHKFT